MRTFILILLVSLSVMSANAHSFGQVHAKQASQSQKMDMRTAGEPVKAPRKASQYDGMPCYNRPAGAFHSLPFFFKEDGNTVVRGFIAVKPFSDYTYHAVPNGYNSENGYYWTDNSSGWYNTREGQDVTLNYIIGECDPPILACPSIPIGSPYESGHFQYPYYYTETGNPPFVTPNLKPSIVISAVSIAETYGYDFLLSSKTFLLGGRYSDNTTMFSYYSGMLPYGNNEDGWWFGKNAGTEGGVRVDGIAQAFEKPEHPYLLKQVALECAFLKVSAPVDMTCKVYKLDQIPAYNDTDLVSLPEVPGEIIARGRATVTPSMDGDDVFFTLYDDEDGLEYDIMPTIDCAILVVIDGYNGPEMENLLDFSAVISSDIHADEGFGELAYLKVGVPDDDDGGNYRYEWCGLNNFFLSGEMKTGLSIFLTLDHPFLHFLYPDEEYGDYLFTSEGGSLQREYSHETVNGIAFFSSDQSCDQQWTMTCNGSAELPDWLDIELIDGEEGPNGYTVIASVTAKPLPKRMTYREAVVRFEIPGDYINFKFMQHKGSIGPILPDVNLILRIILGGRVSEEDRHFADFNKDGVVNISDLNAVLEYIIGE